MRPKPRRRRRAIGVRDSIALSEKSSSDGEGLPRGRGGDRSAVTQRRAAEFSWNQPQLRRPKSQTRSLLRRVCDRHLYKAWSHAIPVLESPTNCIMRPARVSLGTAVDTMHKLTLMSSALRSVKPAYPPGDRGEAEHHGRAERDSRSAPECSTASVVSRQDLDRG